jgi:flotillin
VYVLQQLDAIVAAAVKRVEALEIGQIEIVDRGDGSNIVAMLASFAEGVSRVLEATGAAVGVDIKALLAPQAQADGRPRADGLQR